MNVLVLLVLLGISCQTLVVIAAPDGFNVYKDTLRGRSDDDGDELDEETDPAKKELLSKIIRYYRTPLHLLDDSVAPSASSSSSVHPADVVAQFKKRTVNKFKSAFLYYLTHDLAHLQNLMLFDAWLMAQQRARFNEFARQLPHPQADAQKDATESQRAVYIPRALV